MRTNTHAHVHIRLNNVAMKLRDNYGWDYKSSLAIAATRCLTILESTASTDELAAQLHHEHEGRFCI